jgi:hypothetical protein
MFEYAKSGIVIVVKLIVKYKHYELAKANHLRGTKNEQIL